jgi:hypothetical protein
VTGDGVAEICGSNVEGRRAHDQQEIRPRAARPSVSEHDPNGLAHPPAGAVPLHGVPDGTRRRHRDTHGRLIARQSAEREQLVIARDTVRPDARDVFPSPQSRGVHHSCF